MGAAIRLREDFDATTLRGIVKLVSRGQERALLSVSGDKLGRIAGPEVEGVGSCVAIRMSAEAVAFRAE